MSGSTLIACSCGLGPHLRGCREHVDGAIPGKLDVRTRGEAAVAAGELRLLDDG